MVRKSLFFLFACLIIACDNYQIFKADWYYLDPDSNKGLRSQREYKSYSNPDLNPDCLVPYAAYVNTYKSNSQSKWRVDQKNFGVKVFYPGSVMAAWLVDSGFNREDFKMIEAFQGYYKGDCSKMKVYEYSIINAGQFYRYKLSEVSDSGFVLNFDRGIKYHYERVDSIPREWFEAQIPDWQ